MKRIALVLVTAVFAATPLDGEPSHPLIAALLRVPVQQAAAEQPAAPAANVVTGDEPIDTLESLAVRRSPAITVAVRERVAARLASEPDLLPHVLRLLPRSEAGAAAAWAAFKKLPAGITGGEEFEEVRIWLRRNGNYFRRELVKAARQVKDDDGYVAGEEDLEAYARLDWEAAEPVLKTLAAGAAPRTAALAHALLYAHYAGTDDAAAERERRALLGIAENRAAPARARATAFDALMRTEWDGSVEWYLAQFADPTLIGPVDGHYLLAPLDSPVDEKPDLWIPRVAALTRSGDRVVRSNAASILSQFHLGRARADALEPLLPWLADPDWAEETAMGRLRLIQSIGGLGLRQAIPGLIWICRNDPDDGMRTYAARALLELHEAGAMADVRAVLAGSESAMGRAELEQTLVASGLLSVDEMAEALEAYAAAVSAPGGQERLMKARFGSGSTVSWQVTVGARLARNVPANDALTQKLLLAAEAGDEKGKMLGRIASTIDSPAVHAWLVSRLGENSDPFEIVSLLRHRDAASRSATGELRSAVEKGGIAKGIAAVVLNDGTLISEILRSGTAVEREAALAAARIVAQPLEVADVMQAAENAKDAAAAELAMMNTAPARAALGRLYPGEARIWGPRPSSDPGHTTYTFFDEWEEKLRALQRKRKFDRLDALARASYWGGSGEMVVVGRSGDSMQCVSATGARSKAIPAPAAAELRQFLAEARPEDMGPFESGSADGVQYEYVFLTMDGGRRVFMNNPPFDRRDPHGRLVEVLTSLGCETIARR